MRRMIAIILLGMPPLLLMRWDSHAGHPMPRWPMLAACAPLAVALLVYELSSEDGGGDTGRFIGNGLLLPMGLFGMSVGRVGFALRHEQTVLALFGWVLPVGALVTIVAVVRSLRD